MTDDALVTSRLENSEHCSCWAIDCAQAIVVISSVIQRACYYWDQVTGGTACARMNLLRL